ncbi:MAG TPA: hypothetical protein VH309_11310 [Elusimicrobiota bacterium]|jgi:hypothetical protein|nr:hypothetical protein [Elusimicrobiota bacterium]
MKPILLAAGLAAAAPASAAQDYATYAALYARLMKGASAKSLEDRLPGLAENLETAKEVSKRYWTDSTPFDELAKRYILPDEVLDALGIRHETTGGVVHVPAGMMHTYGYLFSQLRTAYGLKGKRWLESRVDERLGLPAGTFSAVPPKGEFASNVTVAFMRLAGQRISLRSAARLEMKAKAEGFVEQRIVWKTPGGETVKASVFTHLVPLKPLPGLETADADLLIYSAVAAGRRRLVTGFPVDAKFAASIMKTPAGRSASFKPRFNYYVDPSWKVVSVETAGFQTR